MDKQTNQASSLEPKLPQLPQEYKIVPADYGYQYDEDEIDLLELAKTIWIWRIFIIKVVVIGTVVGFLAAILSPKE